MKLSWPKGGNHRGDNKSYLKNIVKVHLWPKRVLFTVISYCVVKNKICDIIQAIFSIAFDESWYREQITLTKEKFDDFQEPVFIYSAVDMRTINITLRKMQTSDKFLPQVLPCIY